MTQKRVSIALWVIVLGSGVWSVSAASSLSDLLGEGTSWLSKGDIKRARNAYTIVSAWAAWDTAVAEVAEEAMFRIAEIDYMTGEIDSARTKFNALVERFPKGKLVNDALEMILFLEEGSLLAKEDLKMIGQAELSKRQGRIDDALARLDTLASHSPLADRVLFVKSRIERQAGRYEGAIATLNRMIATHGESRLRPEATYRIAQIYEVNLGESHKAIRVYEGLIIDYPQSLYADEARIRIRALKRRLAEKKGT
ncbi:MAG: tetratricopeptide repeat protein [Candidatus Latescibacteria bacterium]|nr:tetratricopeptide repeat protein [Candidatus Latescibacterota bacterium]